jgi:hypothetical protein
MKGEIDMTDEQQRKLEQVRKLLELAKSDNVNEAGNAAAQAQRLMSRHAITEAMIDVGQDEDEKAEPITSDVMHAHESQNLPTWKGQLGVVMAECNQCKCYRSGSELRIIGRPSDANTVRYLFSYVAREIDRLTKQESDARGGPGRTWCNNFRLGAVDAVNKRLREAHRDARNDMRREAHAGDTLGTGVALVRVNNALATLDQRVRDVEEYGKRKLHLRSTGHAHTRYDSDARAAGARAGATINLSNGRSASLGSGSRGALRG